MTLGTGKCHFCWAVWACPAGCWRNTQAVVKRTAKLGLPQMADELWAWICPLGLAGAELQTSPCPAPPPTPLPSCRWDSPHSHVSLQPPRSSLSPAQRTLGWRAESGSPSSFFHCVPRAKPNPSRFRDFPFDSQGPFLFSTKPGSQQRKDFGFQNYCFWCGL